MKVKKEGDSLIIYKAENINTGQVYVGATTNSIEQRRLDHIERALRGELNKFHEGICTYGVNAFSWEQIDTASTIDELAQKEKEYVFKYNSKDKGYNSDVGGGFKKTVYQYNLLDGSLVNRYDSLSEAAESIDSTKQHISRACLGVNNIFGGYYWNYVYKEPFVSNSDLRKKSVLQFSLEGDLLERYQSVSEASKQSGVSKTCIARVCRGEREQSGGYIWEYE